MHADRRLSEASFSPMTAIQKEKKKEMREKQVAKGMEQGKRTVNTSKCSYQVESKKRKKGELEYG